MALNRTKVSISLVTLPSAEIPEESLEDFAAHRNPSTRHSLSNTEPSLADFFQFPPSRKRGPLAPFAQDRRKPTNRDYQESLLQFRIRVPNLRCNCSRRSSRAMRSHHSQAPRYQVGHSIDSILVLPRWRWRLCCRRLGKLIRPCRPHSSRGGRIVSMRRRDTLTSLFIIVRFPDGVRAFNLIVPRRRVAGIGFIFSSLCDLTVSSTLICRVRPFRFLYRLQAIGRSLFRRRNLPNRLLLRQLPQDLLI